MEWSLQQKKALDLVNDWKASLSGDGKPYFVLGGYAGTGKTTLARYLARGMAGQVFFVSYTGKAAHVLRRNGVPQATTIHQLIYQPLDKCRAHLGQLKARLTKLLKTESPSEDEVKHLEKEIREEEKNLRRPEFTLKLDSDLANGALLVIDEYSMVSEDIGEDLLSFGCPILALGDPGQLPPINRYPFFKGKPDYMLTEIHRQAAGNPIIAMSAAVREGRNPAPGDYGECQVLLKSQISHADFCKMALDADQVLIGYHRTRHLVNAEMRKMLGFRGIYPVAGDKLVSMRSNHREAILNGQTWMVLEVLRSDRKAHLKLKLQGEEGEVITASVHRRCFEGERGQRELDAMANVIRFEANEFDFGYALTVHKSQGSQWDNVLLIDEWHKEDRPRWLYTGITRAAKRITIIQGGMP